MVRDITKIVALLTVCSVMVLMLPAGALAAESTAGPVAAILSARLGTEAGAGVVDPGNLAVGDKFAVWLVVDGAAGLLGVDVKLEFSRSTLAARQLLAGPIQMVTAIKAIDQQAGTIVYAAANSSPLTEAQATIIKVEFEVVGSGNAYVRFATDPRFTAQEDGDIVWVEATPGQALTFAIGNAGSGSGSADGGNGGPAKQPIAEEEEIIVEVTDDGVPIGTPYKGYTDVASNAWYRDAVAYVTTEGLFKGISADQFGPDIAINRGMFVTILSRLEFGSDEAVPALASPFADLKQEWYKKAVAWAYDKEITLGISGTEFDPDGILTREQMAVFLYRYAEYKGYEVDYDGAVLAAFADQAQTSSWAAEGLAWAVDKGLLQGTAADALSPQEQASRAQAATIFMRFVGLLEADD